MTHKFRGQQPLMSLPSEQPLRSFCSPGVAGIIGEITGWVNRVCRFRIFNIKLRRDMFAVISVVISLLHHRDQPQAVDVKRQHEGEELSHLSRFWSLRASQPNTRKRC